MTARLENPFLLEVHLGEVGGWGQGEGEERRKARRSCLSGQTLESLHRKRREGDVNFSVSLGSRARFRVLY